MTVQTDTVVVGGGQAGLVTSYYLTREGIEHVVLDAHTRIGDAWRDRWDSLRLFTPARVSGLPGMPFPADRGDHYPTKDEIADYLESYAARFDLPVRTGVRVERIHRVDGRLVIETSRPTFVAERVVVAMARYQRPKVPEFASRLDPGIVQLHSHDYRSPRQLAGGPALVVGVGNSGAEIACEIAATRPTWLAGSESAVIPFRHDGAFGRHIGTRVVPFLGTRILTLSTPIGRKIRPKFMKMSAPLVRVKPDDLAAAGVKRVGRITGVEGGLPAAEGHGPIEVANVVWCTGYASGLSWLDLPALDDDGHPVHDRGVAADVPGLYFVGRKFQYAAASDTLAGVARDARYVVRAMASERQRRPATAGRA